MGNIAEKIKVLTEKEGKSLLWLSKEIGMSKQGFYTMLNNNSLKVDTIEKIAAVLNIPVIDFFKNEEKQKENIEVNDKDSKLDYKKEISDLNELIKFLEDTIDKLDNIVTFHEMIILSTKAKIDEKIEKQETGIKDFKEIVQWVQNRSRDVDKLKNDAFREFDKPKTKIEQMASNMAAIASDYRGGGLSFQGFSDLMNSEYENLKAQLEKKENLNPTR
jgi:transcriptional regulator with XRE-family HTH domain